MSLRRTRALARKEFLHVLRDPLSLAMAIAVPLLLLLLFSYALSLDVDEIPTVIYDADSSPQSRDLVSKLEGSRFFKVIEQVEDDAAFEQQLDRNRALLAVWIPQDYAKNLARQRPAPVQVVLDGSDSNTASIALGYVLAMMFDHSLALRNQSLDRRGAGEIRPAVEPVIRVWYNPELESKNYIVPGLIAVILMIVGAMLTSLTVAREYELGNLELLLSTPVRPAEIVLGKMAAYFALGFADAVAAIVMGVWAFGVPLRGSLLELGFIITLFLFGALCWGLLISAATRSQLLAYQIGIITSFLPAFLLSGFVYAIENMPPMVQVITHIVPARYFVSLLKLIFLKGASVTMLWTDVVFLAVYAGVVFALATRQLHRKIA